MRGNLTEVYKIMRVIDRVNTHSSFSPRAEELRTREHGERDRNLSSNIFI